MLSAEKAVAIRLWALDKGYYKIKIKKLYLKTDTTFDTTLKDYCPSNSPTYEIFCFYFISELK